MNYSANIDCIVGSALYGVKPKRTKVDILNSTECDTFKITKEHSSGKNIVDTVITVETKQPDGSTKKMVRTCIFPNRMGDRF